MKKAKFLSVFLVFALVLSLMMPGASASASQPEGDRSSGPAAQTEEDITPTSQLVSDMSVNADAALLVDMDTDYVMFGQDQDKQIYPASTTKILTALVVLQHIDDGDLSLDTTVTCSDTFRKSLTSSAAVANLQSGEALTVESLLYCLLLPSACDAANVLGEAVSGTLDDFGDEMNRVAKECGCISSHFVNPSGLHDDDHYTTCSDLYLITKAAMEYEEFRKIVSTPSYTVPATNLSGSRTLRNTNALLKGTKTTTYNYDGCLGIKTGSTYLAGNCLVSAAQRDGQTLCCIMMGCNWLINRDGSRDKLQFSESIRLFDWGFENFTTEEVLTAGDVVTSIPIARSDDAEAVQAVAVDSLTAEFPADVTVDDLTLSYDYDEQLEAPVSAGDLIGTVTVSLDGTEYGTVDLAAATDVAPSAEKVRAQKTKAVMNQGAKVLKILLIIVLLLAMLFVLLVIRARIIVALRRKRRERERHRHHKS